MFFHALHKITLWSYFIPLTCLNGLCFHAMKGFFTFLVFNLHHFKRPCKQIHSILNNVIVNHLLTSNPSCMWSTYLPTPSYFWDGHIWEFSKEHLTRASKYFQGYFRTCLCMPWKCKSRFFFPTLFFFALHGIGKVKESGCHGALLFCNQVEFLIPRGVGMGILPSIEKADMACLESPFHVFFPSNGNGFLWCIVKSRFPSSFTMKDVVKSQAYRL